MGSALGRSNFFLLAALRDKNVAPWEYDPRAAATSFCWQPCATRTSRPGNTVRGPQQLLSAGSPTGCHKPAQGNALVITHIFACFFPAA